MSVNERRPRAFSEVITGSDPFVAAAMANTVNVSNNVGETILPSCTVETTQQVQGQRKRSASMAASTTRGRAIHVKLSPNRHELKQLIVKTRRAAEYLKELRHSQVCKGRCGVGGCSAICAILSHVDQCTDSECKSPGCFTTRKLLRHADECRCVANINDSDSVNGSPTKEKHPLSPLSTLNQPSPTFCMLCCMAQSHLDHLARTKGYEILSHFNIITPRSQPPASRPLICDEWISSSRVPFSSSIDQIQNKTRHFNDAGFEVATLQNLSSQKQPHTFPVMTFPPKPMEPIKGPVPTGSYLASFSQRDKGTDPFTFGELRVAIGEELKDEIPSEVLPTPLPPSSLLPPKKRYESS